MPLRMIRMSLTILIPAVLLVLYSGCGTGSDSGVSSSALSSQTESRNLPASLYSANTLVVETAYEPGAEPFTGAMTLNVQTWSIFESNIRALFSGRVIEPDAVVPTDLSEMKEINAQNRTGWTASDIISLDEAIWDSGSSPGTVYLHIIFLHGNLMENGTLNKQVIGASISGRTVMVVFKDVVQASGFSDKVEKYVEQATLVHEFGHVAGLVNNGIPMVSSHEDPSHPNHCRNSLCVMFWLNEGAADLRTFVQQMMGSGSLVMFGDECLDDALDYQP